MTAVPVPSSPFTVLRHPVACWCSGHGSDKTCPTRWNGSIGATACPNRRAHRTHPWVGRHPWHDGREHRLLRCRGRRSSWRRALAVARAYLGTTEGTSHEYRYEPPIAAGTETP